MIVYNIGWHQCASHIIYDITNIFCPIFAREKETLNQIKSHEEESQPNFIRLAREIHPPPPP